jgi:hypothetical protein
MLWAMIDLYGSCTALKLIHLETSGSHPDRDSTSKDRMTREVQRQVQRPEDYSMLYTLRRECAPRHHVYGGGGGGGGGGSTPARTRLPPSSRTPQRQYPGADTRSHGLLCPTSFHGNVSRNVRLDTTSTVACRADDEFSRAYVFAASGITAGARVVVKILATEDAFIGSLAFGLTNCHPAHIDVDSLPEDYERLVDRSEYWVVAKDVAQVAQVGDELSFLVNPDGSVECSVNGAPPSILMHVDLSRPLWPFWDLFGRTSKLGLMGSATAQVSTRQQWPAGPRPNMLRLQDSAVDLNLSPAGRQVLSECVICFEQGENIRKLSNTQN